MSTCECCSYEGDNVQFVKASDGEWVDLCWTCVYHLSKPVPEGKP